MIQKVSYLIIRHLAILIFSILYIALAYGFHKDFGLTWDEPVNYNRGVATYEYLFNKKVDRLHLFNKADGNRDIRDGGSFSNFELYLQVDPQKLYDYLQYSGLYPMLLFILNKNKSIDKYHLLNALFALAIFIAVYFMMYQQYRSQKIAILGPLFLCLTPRFTGDIPANPKDVPFAVIYFISCTALYCLAASKNTLTKILVVGILFGITQNLRSAGVTLYAVLFLFDTYVYYLNRLHSPHPQQSWMQFFVTEMQSIMLIGTVALLFSVLTWPFLGITVIPNIREILAIDRSYTWDGTVLYQGNLMKGIQLPGSYFTTWIAITTPLCILIPALLSPFLVRKHFQNRLMLLLLIMILTNSAAYLLVKPVVYDGVRLFLFMVVPLSILGALAVVEYYRAIKPKLFRFIMVALILSNATAVIKEMISLHPYQYIYFNALVGGLQGAYKKYDTEYWGASYNEAINWFKENIATDKNRTYKIHLWAIKYYTIYQADNILRVSPWEAEYNFHLAGRMPMELKKEHIVHVIERKGVPLVYISTVPGKR